MNPIPNINKTILVVEDNDFVRAMASSILQMNGYSVVSAVDGADAFALCTDRKEPIDLILTDVLMPHMTGPELIEKLRNVRGDFRVLYMSGFMDDATFQRMTSSAKVINFINKPFTVPELLNKVSEVLILDTVAGNAVSRV